MKVLQNPYAVSPAMVISISNAYKSFIVDDSLSAKFIVFLKLVMQKNITEDEESEYVFFEEL